MIIEIELDNTLSSIIHETIPDILENIAVETDGYKEVDIFDGQVRTIAYLQETSVYRAWVKKEYNDPIIYETLDQIRELLRNNAKYYNVYMERVLDTDFNPSFDKRAMDRAFD